MLTITYEGRLRVTIKTSFCGEWNLEFSFQMTTLNNNGQEWATIDNNGQQSGLISFRSKSFGILTLEPTMISIRIPSKNNL